MTIIQPGKTNYLSNFFISILVIVSVSALLWGMFLYNQLVDVRHEISKQKDNFQQAEVDNAELKNNLYTIIEAKNLKTLITSQSLIFDKNPEYVKNKQLAWN